MKYSEWLITDLVCKAKSRELVELRCHFCGIAFSLSKNQIQSKAARGINKTACCSHKCAYAEDKKNTHTLTQCANCCKEILKRKQEQQDSKSGKVFCSKSCSVTYHNTHKITGTRRSKLELWLEHQLQTKYPTLVLVFNQKDAINSELDIYIPSLKLAFELNGIFHYEPIYGDEKLKSIQNNDTRKFQACLEHGIELCIIDTSSQKVFKEASAQKYLEIVTRIIDSKLS